MPLTREEGGYLLNELREILDIRDEIFHFKNFMAIYDCINKYIEKKKKEEVSLLMSGCVMLKNKSYVLTIREMEDE